MGDRANIFFRGEKGGVGVYGHWAGRGMAMAAARVMTSKAFKARIGDANYATRIGVQIVLEELGAKSKEETGFGIWTAQSGPDDNEHKFIVIDVNTGEVFVSNNWKKPGKADLVPSPTANAILERMGSGDDDDGDDE